MRCGTSGVDEAGNETILLICRLNGWRSVLWSLQRLPLPALSSLYPGKIDRFFVISLNVAQACWPLSVEWSLPSVEQDWGGDLLIFFTVLNPLFTNASPYAHVVFSFQNGKILHLDSPSHISTPLGQITNSPLKYMIFSQHLHSTN